MIEKYDVVKSLRDLNNNVLKDCKGTVLTVYRNQPPDYEVEFINDNFETLDILTVKSSDIMKFKL